jgi:hypothetical protein
MADCLKSLAFLHSQIFKQLAVNVLRTMDNFNFNLYQRVNKQISDKYKSVIHFQGPWTTILTAMSKVCLMFA